MSFLFFLMGITAILGLLWLISADRINALQQKRVVAWGLGLQLLFGLVVIYWPSGNQALKAVSNSIADFLNFATEGSKMVFGDLAAGKLGFIFAFAVLPTIIFFSAFMSILYHYGIMQRVVMVMAWIMSRTMGTSGPESLSCAANVFVGQTEAPLIVRPYVSRMTMSELNAVMVGGFGTIAGGIMAYFIMLGVKAEYIITASLMAAPASLMVAKIIFPETSKDISRDTKADLKVNTSNVIEAAAKGASDGLSLALNVGAMLIAFVALIAVLNALLNKLDWLIDYQILGCVLDKTTNEYMGIFPGSLRTIFSYLLWPLGWLMGVPYQDCGHFAYLVGMKISVNEIVGYTELIAIQSQLQEKTVIMATFAMCGFANFSSIAIQIGGLSPLAEGADQQDQLRKKLASLGLRAMIGGAMVSCLTATIAGFLYGK